MKKPAALAVVLSLALSGCSSIGSGWDNTVDFIFGPDDGAGQRQEAAAKMASDAAGSANPEQSLVDGVVKKSVDKAAMSTAGAIDNSMAHSKTDISITGIKSKKTRYAITNVKGFEPSDNGHAQTFMQSSLANANSRAVLNLGLGRRYLSEDESVITGFNVFLDYDPKYGHQRASIGAELKASAFELTANSYKALTKWKKGKSGNQERALDGHDIELGAQIPYMPAAKLYVKNWKWKGEDGVGDTKGNTYSLAFSHLVNGVQVELGRRDYDGLTKDENFGQLTYTIPMGWQSAQSSKPLFSSEMFESASMKNKMLDKVRRNNAIVIQTKFVAGIGGV
ncbi:inverse autotransporter beta domain-containing protein [Alphaproteobacteria bacterium]|nr:inverse autotransporter beta domain-containing protein [Alphaproteobacteria bacterium]